MTTTATPGLDERLRRLKPVDLYGTGAMNYLVPPYLHDEIVAALTAPAGGEVRALREALEPFAKLADEIDALNHEEHSTCLHRIAATDLRRAKTVLASLPPAEAAQAGEATMAEQVERTKICSALRDAGLMLEPVPDGGGAWHYKVTPLPTPSREERPTDEQVERALAEWSKPNERREPSEIMRAALKAALSDCQNAGGEQHAPKADDLTDEDRIAYWKCAYERMAARNVTQANALTLAVNTLDDLASGTGLSRPIEQIIRELNDCATSGGVIYPAPNGVSGSVREALEKAAQAAAAKGADLRNDDATRRGGVYAAYLIREILAALSQEPSPSSMGGQ